VSQPRFFTLLWLCLLAATGLAGRDGRAQTAMPPSGALQPVIDTGCGERDFLPGYYLEGSRRTFDDERYSAFVLRLNTPVYQDSSGETRAAKVLGFSERVGIIDPGMGKDRIRVKDNREQPIGWVARNDLLCRLFPISGRNQTGFAKRVIVGTDATVQGQSQVKKVYQTPQSLPADQRCERGVCAEVRPFQSYLVYAEDNDHYLIAGDANLGNSSSRLVGWLPKGDGYIWDTGLGLRPREELADVANGTPEKFACAYKTMDDLKSGSNCIQLFGGRRWFGLNVRMAVLDVTTHAYEVFFPDGIARRLPSVDDPLCLRSGNQCGAQPMETLSHAYVPIDDKVIPEVLLSRDQLDKWLKLVNIFKMANGSAGAGRTRWLNELWSFRESGSEIETSSSKLLQYSYEELGKVSDCEIAYLKQYAAKRYDILNIIFSNEGKLRPVFTLVERPEGGCPNLSDRAKSLPFIDGDVRAQRLTRPGEQAPYSMMHRRGNSSFFWVPVKDLP
jgi:hypothetical protein